MNSSHPFIMWFRRLAMKFPRKKKCFIESYETTLAKISRFRLYVSNLPRHSAPRICSLLVYVWHVVDSFIPMKRSKEGKRFGFVKFINVSNVERLCGPYLKAGNIRNSKSVDRHLGGLKEHIVSGQRMGIKNQAIIQKLINHAGVLNWFHELGNANNSFVSDIRLVWIAIEGLPMCAWNNKALSKIVSPWGTLTPVDLVEDSSFATENEITSSDVEFCRNTPQDKDIRMILVVFTTFLIKQDIKEAGFSDCDPSQPHGFIKSSSVGLSGGILCVWDPNSFVKDNATISDYFVAVVVLGFLLY
ncbi:hypothetical protein Tco_0236899 [Tanacetum coccineum]